MTEILFDELQEFIKLINIEENNKYSHEEIIKYIDIINKELKKQLPIEPYIYGDGYYDGELVYDMYGCPTCSESYELDYIRYKCCPNCGQHLKWDTFNDEYESVT